MQVETYELIDSIPQNEMQALAEEGEATMLIEQLGLEGQRSRSNNNKETHSYRQITAEELFVFQTLFPNKTSIEKYDGGPIPLRVLQVAAHVRLLELEQFKYLEVWHPKPGIDDPVLVARKDSWSDPVYLLARWGNALKPFADLKLEALKVQAEKTKVELEEILSTVQNKLNNVTSYVNKCFINGKIPRPQFYE